MMQKTSDFSKFMVCPHGQGVEGVQPVDILWTRGSRERVNFSHADILYGPAPNNESYYRYHMYRTICACLMKTTVVALA